MNGKTLNSILVETILATTLGACAGTQTKTYCIAEDACVHTDNSREYQEGDKKLIEADRDHDGEIDFRQVIQRVDGMLIRQTYEHGELVGQTLYDREDKPYKAWLRETGWTDLNKKNGGIKK